jgi:acyl-CoA dehydrogenase
MTGFSALRSPLSFLQSSLEDIPHRDVLNAEEAWWKSEGVAISNAIDRAGTPWLRMFDRLGKRVDEILYPREYQTILRRGYRSGVVWRALEEKSLIPTYLLIYNISFHDPGICCPYTVSLGTAVPLAKYGSAELQARFLPQLLRKDDSVWQGATWMTEIKGGSDLGAAVETTALDRRQIFHEQCRRGVSRGRRARGRSHGGCARAVLVPGAAISQERRA